MPQSIKRRDRRTMNLEVLEACSVLEKRTHVMSKTAIPWGQLILILENLKSRGLIDDERKPTPLGVKIIMMWREINRALEPESTKDLNLVSGIYK